MRTNRNLIAVVAILGVALLGTRAQAEAPKSIAGTWKVKSFESGGKEQVGVGLFGKGAVWKFENKGVASVGGYDWSWSYDATDGEVVLTRPILFGLSEDKFKASVSQKGKDIVLSFQALLENWELVLTAD